MPGPRCRRQGNREPSSARADDSGGAENRSAWPAIKFSSHFRLAGLNYLEMINIASTSLRTVMKEPARTEALSAAKFHYRQYTYENAVESEPAFYDEAGKKADE